VTLRDSRVALIAPLHPDDRERYLSGMTQMSPESLYKRFMTPEDSGEAVGVTRFIRAEAQPVAEAAIIVIDSWQGSGLGKAMLRMLAQRAREVGVERFDANVLSDNASMLALLDSLGPRESVRRDGSSLVITVPLPEQGIGEHETGVLKEVESGEFELVTPADGLETGG